MRVSRLKRSQIPAWLRLRSALWPREPIEEHQRDMTDILSDEDFNAVFVSLDGRGGLTGFVEVTLRMQAEGCRTSPVGYIEGWFVVPRARRKGIGRALVNRAEAWAASQGCREMASDAEVENDLGRAAHRGAGYAEIERLAHYRKELPQPKRQA
jgi:aminoglycoside 6'-N-acetyltransferase I